MDESKRKSEGKGKGKDKDEDPLALSKQEVAKRAQPAHLGEDGGFTHAAMEAAGAICSQIKELAFLKELCHVLRPFGAARHLGKGRKRLVLALLL